jgi:hypothetical protein
LHFKHSWGKKLFQKGDVLNRRSVEPLLVKILQLLANRKMLTARGLHMTFHSRGDAAVKQAQGKSQIQLCSVTLQKSPSRHA